MNIKQVIVVRKDLKMNRGKEIAQCCHASIAFLTSRIQRSEKIPELTSSDWSIHNLFLGVDELEWICGIFKKITLQVNSEEELLRINKECLAVNLTCHLIKDSALTYFDKPTYTCLAIGPNNSSKIDQITKNLRLY